MNKNKAFANFSEFSKSAGLSRLLQVFILICCSYSVSGQISRTQVITNAEAYVNHTWTADSSNIWQNIYCPTVVNILTPVWVRVDTINTGIPYCWGGWSSVTSFDTGISKGKSAGNNDCTTNGDLTEKCAVGVDCSGLVTNVWGITSQKYSTSTLMNITTAVALSASKQADILNWPYHHTRIVVENNYYTTGYIEVIESSAADWKVAKHSYKPSALANYQPRCPVQTIVYDSGTTDLADIGAYAVVTIYPNPATDMLNIKSQDLEGDQFKIILANISGQIMLEKEYNPRNNIAETQLDLKELSSGIYFLTLKSAKIHRVFKVQKL